MTQKPALSARAIMASYLVKPFEECKTKAYNFDGHWTIGYGHCGCEVKEGTVWSTAKCISQLVIDCNDRILAACKASPCLTMEPPARQAAIADFIYNCGIGRYRESKLLKPAVDNKDWRSAAAAIMAYNKYHNLAGELVVSTGLARRRKVESDMLLTGDYEA